MAQDLQPVPDLAARVTDLTGTLAPEERRALEEKLARFEARKGAQVAVLVVSSTAPEPVEAYAIRVADAWRIGRAGSDDGALLLVAKDDRRLRIEVGRGLEGALTDLAAKRIIDETIAPRFRAGDFAGGIDAGLDRMLAVIEGEPLPPPAPRRRGGGDAVEWSPLVVVGLPLLSLALRAGLGLAGPFLLGAFVTGAVWLATGQLALALALGFFTLFAGLVGGGGRRWSSRRGRGAGWSGAGGSGWGGGGGGGFSGGGGGFGGGGASGSW